MEETLAKILDRIESLESAQESINQKLDTILELLAKDSRAVNIKDIAAMVKDHETDIRIIKKLLTNQ